MRLLYLIFLRLLDLLLLLGRSSASKNIDSWCCATKSPCGFQKSAVAVTWVNEATRAAG
jgi:hypothetical protein